MIAALVVLASTALPWPGFDAPVDASPRIAVFEVEGPLAQLVLRCEDSETELIADLGPGETRRVRIPFSHLAVDSVATPQVPNPGSTRIRFLEWEESQREARWSQIPSTLRTRPIPVLSGTRARPTRAAWLLLASGVVLTCLLRTRRRLATLAGVGAALALWLLPVVETVGRPALVVLEGDAASGRWLEVEVRSREAKIDLDSLLRLGVVPADARLSWKVVLDRAGGVSYLVQALGRRAAHLVLCRSAHPLLQSGPGAGLERAKNGLETLRICWLRSPPGQLVAHGRWELGQGLPQPATPSEPPPGWLLAGSAPGRWVLLGRLADRGERERWIRLVGFSGD